MVPYFKEIKLERSDKKYLFKKLRFSKLGTMPFFINIKDDNNEDEVFENLIDVIEENELKILFPYPLYIITNETHPSYTANLLRDEKDLPLFFISQEKKLNTRELAIMRANRLKFDRLEVSQNSAIQQRLKKFGHQHKELFLQCYEGEFLEKIMLEIEGDG